MRMHFSYIFWIYSTIKYNKMRQEQKKIFTVLFTGLQMYHPVSVVCTNIKCNADQADLLYFSDNYCSCVCDDVAHE